MYEAQVKTVLGSSQIKSTFPEHNDIDGFYAADGYLMIPSAFRFGGPREAYKFKLAQKNTQSLVLYFVNLSDSIVGSNTTVVNSFSSNASSIAELQHLRLQIEFQEFIRLKSTKRKW